MGASARMAAGALALALFGASGLPCPEASGPTHVSGAHGHAANDLAGTGAAVDGGSGHPPGCPEAGRTTLSTPCPCGCGDRAPASPAGRLGMALPSWLPSLAGGSGGRPPSIAAPLPGEAPRRAIDHVPLVG